MNTLGVLSQLRMRLAPGPAVGLGGSIPGGGINLDPAIWLRIHSTVSIILETILLLLWQLD